MYFKPIPFSDKEMVGAFAVVLFEDGSMMYDTMSKNDIENVRNTYSKAKDSQAWRSSTGEMYKKTVLRRLCKLIDLDFDNRAGKSLRRWWRCGIQSAVPSGNDNRTGTVAGK